MNTIKYTLHINDQEFKIKRDQMIESGELDPFCQDEAAEVMKALFFDHFDGYFSELYNDNFEIEGGTNEN